MKKIVFCLVMALLSVAAFSQQTAKVLSNTDAQLRILFTTPQLSVNSVTTDAGTFAQVNMDGFGQASEVGMPALPVYTALFEIPQGADIQVAVENVQSRGTVRLKEPMFPAQAPRRKSDTSRVSIARNMQVYGTNADYALPLVSTQIVGTARATRLAQITFSPVSYNPVTGAMQIYSEAEVTITFNHADLAATRQLKALHSNNVFNAGVPLLSQLPTTKEVRTGAPVRMLIVSHSSFRGQLDEFIQWKRRKGFLTDVVYTDSIGTTTTAIKNYIVSQYTNATAEHPAPTYLLLVGDKEQIPAYSSSSSVDNDHITDLYYSTWTSGDNIPDCYYGRFSAQTVAQLTPQIEKTLMYEQYTFEDPSFLDRAVLVAGVDGGYSGDHGYTYGDPNMDYVATNYVNGDFGYQQVMYFKNKTSNNPNASNVTVGSSSSSNAANIRTYYSQGAGWINYTAHGNWDEWSIPSFTVSHVNSMSNTQKFGFMIGNCCLSGKFDKPTCFGEALLRRDGYRGAVAYIGASNSSYWDQDVYWSMGVRSSISASMSLAYNSSNKGIYDRLFHTHGEAFADQYAAGGAIVMAGNMAVQSSSSTAAFKLYYWEIYHLFGDPSVMPWLTQADTMRCEVSPTVISGATTITANVVPNAYVALTQGDDHQLLGATFADIHGVATITLDNPLTPGSYEFAASAQQCLTEFRTITVIAPDGPYAAVSESSVQGSRNVGDTVRLSVRLSNLGNAVANNVALTVFVDSTQAHLVSSSTVVVSSLATNADTLVSAVFPMVLRPGLANGATVNYRLQATWNGGSDTAHASGHFAVNAPQMAITYLPGAVSVLPGDSVAFNVEVSNIGAMDMDNASINIASTYPLLTVGNPSVTMPLAAGASRQLVFYAHADARMIEGIQLPINVSFGNYFYQTYDTLQVIVGELAVEDFESNSFTTFPWQVGTTRPWTIDHSTVHSGSSSARSSSNTGGSQSSVLQINYTANQSDSITFYYKVSSEDGYDKFNFYIDGATKIDGASGEVDWTRASFPVSAGSHTFKFEYKKDWSVNNGSDCAWIDDVTFPNAISSNCQLIADTVCRGQAYTFHNNEISTTQTGMTVITDTVGNVVSQLCLLVVDIPEVTVTASSSEIVAGQSTWLYAHGAARYVWSTGETTDSIYVSPQSATTYSVEGFMGTCSDVAEITVNVKAGIADHEASDAQMLVYPNPATTQVAVSLAGLQQVQLYNALGQMVRNTKAQGDAVILSLQGLPSGTYFLRALTDSDTRSAHIVIR